MNNVFILCVYFVKSQFKLHFNSTRAFIVFVNCCLLSKCYLTNKVNYPRSQNLLIFLFLWCFLVNYTLDITHFFRLLLYLCYLFLSFYDTKNTRRIFMCFGALLLSILNIYLYLNACNHPLISNSNACQLKSNSRLYWGKCLV